MITLALAVLIVVCLSIGATIGLAVATIIQVNKGEDGDANYIERQAALTKQKQAKPEGYAYEKAKRWSRGELTTLSTAKEEGK